MTKEQVEKAIKNAPVVHMEPPQPLRKKADPPVEFPVEALGEILGNAATAIQDKIQAPLAICAQSVLATAALAVQGHADVLLPFGQTRPISNYWLTIAGSGERKTAVDHEANAPLVEYEAELSEQYNIDHEAWKNKRDAWEKHRNVILKGKGK